MAAPDLGAALGLDDLWLKDETANPTGSFKDRVVAATVARAQRHRGVAVLACSSTGNLARALAVGAAEAGLRSVVVVPEVLGTDERRTPWWPTVRSSWSSGATTTPPTGSRPRARRHWATGVG